MFCGRLEKRIGEIRHRRIAQQKVILLFSVDRIYDRRCLADGSDLKQDLPDMLALLHHPVGIRCSA